MNIIKVLLCLTTFATTIICSAQSFGPSAVQWQQSFGGTGYDYLYTLRPTTDHGFIALGDTDANGGGNKASPSYGRDDLWLVRFDAMGAKIWEKTLGGSELEHGGDILQTADGGFVVATSSDSEANGTKTSTNYGFGDVWVIRLDAEGNQLWDRSFGGTNGDWSIRILPTTNGGFIIGGNTFGTGGNKSSSTFGSVDFWLICLNSNGDKLWERIYGGSEDDTMSVMEPTTDGGFVLGGYSFSGMNGNKTSTNYGEADMWVIRVDANGNKLWEQTIGGDGYDFLNYLKQTADGGFALGGTSSSGVSGNKTSPTYGFPPYGPADAWFVTLDSNGNKVLDRAYGGSLADAISCVKQLPDGGFLLGAGSNSDDHDRVGGVANDDDLWIIRTDASGNRLWDLSLGGTNLDFLSAMEMTPDGGYLLAGTSYSPVSGSKTSPFYGAFDYWIVKLSPERPILDIGRTSPSEVELHWQSLTGRVYAVEYSTNLSLTNWTTLTNITASGNLNIVRDDISSGQRLYRLLLVP